MSSKKISFVGWVRLSQTAWKAVAWTAEAQWCESKTYNQAYRRGLEYVVLPVGVHPNPRHSV